MFREGEPQRIKDPAQVTFVPWQTSKETNDIGSLAPSWGKELENAASARTEKVLKKNVWHLLAVTFVLPICVRS